MRAHWTLGTLLLAGCAAAGAALPANVGLSREGVRNIGAQALPIGAGKEHEIGFGIAAIVVGRYPLSPDTALQRYVNLVGQTVAAGSPRHDEVEFRFGVLDTDDVNAFAAPGGYVFVTRGALALMESEAELAGVLAHEVGHVDRKHVLDEIRRSAVLQTARDETQLTGPLLDQVAALGTGLLFTGLSREDELEADSLGVLYAAAAGYRADGLLAFLAHLQQAETAPAARGLGASLEEMRATHPPVADRVAGLQRQLSASTAAAAAGSTEADRFRRYVPRGR